MPPGAPYPRGSQGWLWGCGVPGEEVPATTPPTSRSLHTQLVKSKAVVSPPSRPCVSSVPPSLLATSSPSNLWLFLKHLLGWGGHSLSRPLSHFGSESASVGFPLLVLAPAETVPTPSAPPETVPQTSKVSEGLSPREQSVLGLSRAVPEPCWSCSSPAPWDFRESWAQRS